MLIKTLFCYFLLLLPPLVFASGGGEVLFVLWAIQILVFCWPIVLPLFFLQKNKIKSYFLFVLVMYGIIGLLNAPLSFYVQIAVYFDLPVDIYSFELSIATNVVSLIISILFLRKYTERLSNIFDDNSV
jgi:hypothetical protein